jgi:hypothetical protein
MQDTTIENIPDYNIKLYPTLHLAPEIFLENYNIDISEYTERHKAKEDAQKGGSAITYMSYSHAFRLFRTRHPGWEVDCVVNPLTGGYVFEEIDRRGYFVKSFIHDGSCRSAAYYNALLTMSGQGVHPDDVKSDYQTKKPKLSPLGNPIYVTDSQSINKAVYRAKVKAIALCTGIGLKLWTGDDLSEDVLDAKLTLLTQVKAVAAKYTSLSGLELMGVNNLDYTCSEQEIRDFGRKAQAMLKEASTPKLSEVTEVVPKEPVQVQVDVDEPAPAPSAVEKVSKSKK